MSISVSGVNKQGGTYVASTDRKTTQIGSSFADCLAAKLQADANKKVGERSSICPDLIIADNAPSQFHYTNEIDVSDIQKEATKQPTIPNGITLITMDQLQKEWAEGAARAADEKAHPEKYPISTVTSVVEVPDPAYYMDVYLVGPGQPPIPYRQARDEEYEEYKKLMGISSDKNSGVSLRDLVKV